MRFRFLTTAALWLAKGTAVVGLALNAHTAMAAGEYLSRPEVQSFIETMQTEHGLELAELQRVLGEVRYQPTVVRLIGPERPKPSAVKPVRSYPRYRAKFLTDMRISAGVRY